MPKRQCFVRARYNLHYGMRDMVVLQIIFRATLFSRVCIAIQLQTVGKSRPCTVVSCNARQLTREIRCWRAAAEFAGKAMTGIDGGLDCRWRVAISDSGYGGELIAQLINECVTRQARRQRDKCAARNFCMSVRDGMLKL